MMRGFVLAVVCVLALVLPSLTTAEIIDFNFENGTNNWILGHSNGATWKREANRFTDVAPDQGTYMLRVYSTDFHSSVVMATSPRMRVGPGGTIRIAAHFFMKGSGQYPAYLKFRRSTSYTTFDEFPFLNLDSFGDQSNNAWLTHGIILNKLEPGEEFNIVMEASLGIANYDNAIAVSRVQIEGAELVDYVEESFFDFSNGLAGWTMGSVEGGRWLVYNHSEINANFYIPPPSLGDNILVLDRFDIHSGVVTIESPPLSFHPGILKELNIRFWMRGTPAYPCSVRIRRKSLDGVYDPKPFIDLTSYGNVNNLKWLELDNFYRIPFEDQKMEYFQLVIEADLGSGLTNLAAIEAIRVMTSVVPPAPPAPSTVLGINNKN